MIYTVTYLKRNVTQELRLLSKREYADYKQFKVELNNLAERKIKDAYNALKHVIALNFGDSFFVEGSPLHQAMETGILVLPEHMGGKQKVTFKLKN